MFVNREQEIAFLNSTLERNTPTTAQMILLYGRRRVGKTVLARHWADATGLPTIYWAAEDEPAALQRRKLFARMTDVPLTQAAAFESWADLWQTFAKILGERQHILILDEIPYAAQADSAFLSALQHAWDQRFKDLRLFLLLSGSHVHTMETLLSRGSPLFGRFTGQWHLQPLKFSAMTQFLPGWKADQRVAAYAIVGGVPAYLAWLRPKLSLINNIRQVILAPGSVFTAEPAMLLADQVREPRAYQAILQAIGAGAHTLDEVANAALIGKAHLSAYLARLQELRLVERRLPATIPPRRKMSSRMGRYHLTDPFLRFYFRFIAPMRDDVGFRPEGVLAAITQQLRAYVGATAFEELCRDWVRQQSDQGQLPFQVAQVGSHWSRTVQVDVAAVNWQDKAVLIGECKWGTDRVAKAALDELIEGKTPQLAQALPDAGRGWAIQHVFFARAGFTPEAQAFAKSRRVTLVDLDRLDSDLRNG